MWAVAFGMVGTSSELLAALRGQERCSRDAISFCSSCGFRFKGLGFQGLGFKGFRV